MVAGVLEALLVMEMLPGALPAEVGEKETVTVVWWPELRLKGSETPLTPNCAPVRVACVTVRVSVPVFVTIMAWVSVLPTTTDGKLMEGGVKDIVAEPVDGLEVMPAQPTCMTIPNNRAVIQAEDVRVVGNLCEDPRRLGLAVSVPTQSMRITQLCDRPFDQDYWSSVQKSNRRANLPVGAIKAL